MYLFYSGFDLDRFHCTGTVEDLYKPFIVYFIGMDWGDIYWWPTTVMWKSHQS